MIPPDENAMQKEGEAMRKSNVIIIAILMVASIAFLWLWNYLGSVSYTHLTLPTKLEV